VASTTAQQAFTGLGNTSFGQANIGAIQRQGALDLGLLGEREQMTMADLIGQQTQAAFGAQTSAAANLFNAGSGFTQGLTNLQMGLAGNLFQGQQAIAGNVFGAQQNMAAQSLQGGQMQAQNVGTGFNLGGALLGAGIGALGSIASGYGAGLAGNGD
ncbi:MAG: hypothetical protein VYC81_03765, partial [Actinomycetota bacterium]|nr:hypothetical protein [Actinomycetota bacterium]